MKWIFLSFCLFTLCPAQYNDIEFVCDPGYRVSAIGRGGADDKKVGELTVECDEIPGKPKSTCAPAAGPLVCDGTEEECVDGYLGGILGFELNKVTGAVLFQPICCTGGITIDTSSCKGKRLNAIRSSFKGQIRDNQVFTSFKCWKQYDLNNVIHDFIWKPTVCKFKAGGGGGGVTEDNGNGGSGEDSKRPVARGGGGDSRTCEKCVCECGPFTCPAGRRRLRLVHRTKRSNCECVCNCSHKCV